MAAASRETLFALVSAFFESGGSDTSERQALEWLEQQSPPGICAGVPGEGALTMAYVPTNYPGDNVPALRGKQPRYFPAQGPSDAKVHFIWSPDPPPGVADAIDRMASRAAYLGKACSMVQMRIAKSPPEPNYALDPQGGEVLRVPSRGRLKELEWLFQSDQQRRRELSNVMRI